MEFIEFINVIDVPLTRAAVGLLHKFHRETDCGGGDDGYHWVECEAVASTLGFEDYDDLLDQIDRLNLANQASLALH